MRRIFGFLTLMMPLVFMGCSTSTTDTPTEDKVVTMLAIPGVIAPVGDATPITTAIDTAQYTGTITWSPAHSSFATSTIYTANIVLTAKTGWTLTGVAANSFTVAGATATNALDSGVVTAVFPVTGTADTSSLVKTVTLLAISGVEPPVRGATPVTMAIDTEQYTGTISWSGTPETFAANTVYTATIILTPKAGWTFSGVAENSFTVAGATVTNARDSGAITAVFRITGASTDIDVTFLSAVQVGGAWNSLSSTSLTLTFSADIPSLSESDIILTGATKGALTGSGTTRSLAISAITVGDGEKVFVTIASPTGYAIAGSIRTAVVYKEPTAVTFLGATQVGGALNSFSSTSLTLSFSADPTSLAASDITLTGASKGAFTGSGTTRTLSISNIAVADGASVSVAVASPVGFVITGSPKTAVVYKAPLVITQLAIPGIIAPVLSAIPETRSIDTDQYTGTISWTPSAGSFAPFTAYTANISLTAKAGWTFNGVASNSFKVAGATVTNAANSGTVAAVFPKTALLDMVAVPAGTFQRDATITNTSTVSAFRMSKYEITRAQYTAVTLAIDPSLTDYSSGTTSPIQFLTWYEAIEFCNKLSAAENLTEVYTISGRTPATGYPITSATVTVPDWNANGYRLPTDMEWQWAAMGATAGTTGYTKAFAGSNGINMIGDYVWYNTGTGDRISRPVGRKLPNELGLYDMSGNVWEMNWDWYAPYPDGPLLDYRGPADSGSYRVLHGGAWDTNVSQCNVVYRHACYPSERHACYGFRVVRR